MRKFYKTRQEYSPDDSDDYSKHGFYHEGSETDRYTQDWAIGKLQEMSPCGTVIDAGCGTGRWFEKFPPHRKLIAIDVSRNMLERIPGKKEIFSVEDDFLAEAMNKHRPSLIHGDLERVLPRLKGSADLMFSYLSLCENNDPEKMLRIFHDTLRLGGRAIVVTNVVVEKKHKADDCTLNNNSNGVFSDPPINPYFNGRERYNLCIFLQMPTGILPIVDKVHVPTDYYAPDSWDMKEAAIIPWSSQVLVDGKNRKSLEKHFPAYDIAQALSIEGTDRMVAHLCLDMIRK
uniref:Methyltransferase domain-containing protein n=1 Tax=Candidatus Kentrum sp. LFY TaxID=2126342 RepID=A0A450UE20_9GAMM|nr:MAG: Methyltransferase domain-containing protein [Candidatus Kentron sp. LFY]